MRHHPRIRCIAKCAGICLCVLVIGAWCFSLRWGLSFYHRVWRVTIAASSISVFVATSGPDFDDLDKKYRSCGSRWFCYPIRPYSLSDYGLVLPYQLRCGRARDATDTVIPLWLPLLPAVFTTAILFYCDHHRRFRPGHCPKCNYNLTGNESGVCPECGSLIQFFNTASEA
jgi:hypothetical protein